MGVGTINGISFEAIFGIFIGIETFPSAQLKTRSLMYPNEDASQVCNFFTNYCKGMRMDHRFSLFVNQEFIDNKPPNDDFDIMEGTRVNILRCLSSYLNEVSNNDLVLVYISTHGVIDYNDYFFVPSDGEFENILGTGISSNTLIQALGKASSNDVNVLMIIDTCFSGGISFDIAKYKGAFSCLLSASPVEYSYEFNSLSHGVFTYYLLEVLNNSINSNKPLTLVELFDYVYKKVQEKTIKKQNPLMIGTLKYDFRIL